VVLRNLPEVVGVNLNLIGNRSHYDVMFVTAHTIWLMIVIKTKQKAKASHHHRKSLESSEEQR